MKFIRFLSISLLILFLMPYDVTAQSNVVEVHFIDVGQADSILITYGEKAVLVDAGDNGDGETVSNYIKKLGINQLDYIVATHPHHDHIGGMDDVIENFDVQTVMMPDVSYPTVHYKSLLKVLKKKDITLEKARKGMKIKLGHQVNIKVISPSKEAEYEDFNDYSAVLRLSHKENSFLLMGDAGVEVEKQMLEKVKMKQLKSDVLKMGHHGASSATSETFLKAVTPETAVISVGKNNRYDFPDKNVIQRLNEHHISVLRTDEIGTIIATSDGENIVFHTDNNLISHKKDK
ncbi:ComEC/Rec2 family competence protein [Guptibacillus hwajinpoensis]|uniref:ComEC/Rec2 family competence protein n=1 Tax=Guptibacillus hwajinpoensis TaxID=208199 RepID=UPI001CFCE09C|nr:MBL fold metallo-hydrolase [Pseudalkalibacillus hwajinpoensis]WLR58424.1 MBL fold metallo-hydrolase [Pseudalkalibacillus hwajinpoensis]